jgi:predicted O-methyltransferase YrrM
MNRYWSHIHHFVSAKKRHGIHSPFVYALSDTCFNIPISQSDQEILSKQFKRLESNNNSIQVTDYGAGSKIMGTERKINSIFKNSRSNEKYARLLYQLSRFYKPKRILELGTSLAWGTLHLHLGHPETIIETVEGCPQTYAAAKELFPVQSENVIFHNERFDEFFENLDTQSYDLIFIDGNHKGDALISYIELLKEHAHNDTIWILDDIRWSDDMWKAWEAILHQSKFNLTIDLGRMALAAFRKQQEKEHFMLRI